MLCMYVISEKMVHPPRSHPEPLLEDGRQLFRFPQPGCVYQQAPQALCRGPECGDKDVQSRRTDAGSQVTASQARRHEGEIVPDRWSMKPTIFPTFAASTV
jgi:hypothetical protein